MRGAQALLLFELLLLLFLSQHLLLLLLIVFLLQLLLLFGALLVAAAAEETSPRPRLLCFDHEATDSIIWILFAYLLTCYFLLVFLLAKCTHRTDGERAVYR